MPFPSTRVIPKDWSAHHQRVVEGAFNARMMITDPSKTLPGEWDPDTGTYGPPTPFIVAGGPSDARVDWRAGVPCRIQQNKDERAIEQADQALVIRLYLIQFPVDIPLFEVGFVGTVTDCPNDPLFEGEQLVVSDRMHGSEAFNRDLVWIHNLKPEVQNG